MRLHAQRFMATCAVACSALLLGGGGSLGVSSVRAESARATDAPASTPSASVRLGPGAGNGRRSATRRRSDSSATARKSAPRRPASRQRRSSKTSAELAPSISAVDKQLFGLTHAWSARAQGLGFPQPLQRRHPSVRTSGLPLSSTLRSLPNEQNVDTGLLHGLSLPNLPVRLEGRTLRYLRFYRDTARGRRAAKTLSKKAARYTPSIVAALKKAQLPTDLVWLSLIESGHNATIRSPAGAAGLWQFMPDSARAHGLKVNRWIDERLDPVRSTQAAIQYLSELKRRFGTWELAMAAYNMGHYGLSRAIRKYNTNDFWRLSRLEAALPWETTLYVPKVLAVATIMRNRQEFGLSKLSQGSTAGYETVQVPPGVSFSRLARRAGVSSAELHELNPQYLGYGTPPTSPDQDTTSWAVNFPAGQVEKVVSWLEHRPAWTPGRTLRVRQGDTLATIAYRARTTESALLALNGLRRRARLTPGTPLLRPEPAEGSPLGLREDQEAHVLVSRPQFRYENRQRVFYRTTAGDRLHKVAEAFHTSPSDLRLWNDLDPRATLQSGMVLQLFVPHNAEFPNVRFASERNSGKRLSVGSPSFFSHFESEKGRSRLQIQSRAGDTLYSIGKRYGLSGGMMARINHQPQKRKLIPGSPIVVYAKYGPIPQEILLSQAVSPLPPANPPHPASLPSPGSAFED